MQIAPQQKEKIDFLDDLLKGLQKSVGRNNQPAFRELERRVGNWAAKIAVIGQVKAGKSTFMNSFLGETDLLPSDVNPWTSVVTNIRINVPWDPANGASFEFFDETDWQEVIDGTSEIRKLTEELLPGFDTEILRQQSEEMRARAQRRLGNHYHALLGTKHEYDFLSSELLQRYICAGPGADAGLEREALGRYTALTKVANIYLRRPEFQVPCIVTDTPGVNDPFLVRDEFTCRSLDKSDVFVMVLSAHQPLTNVDVALIRILAEQDSKDVVIFINRIDELDDYNRQVPRVIDDVANRLKAAIPDVEFPIIAGSAFLANLAFRSDPEALEMRKSVDDEQLRAYLMTTQGSVPEDPRDRLIAASGMGVIKEHLSHLIDRGVGRQQLNQILEDTRAEISGALYSAKRERRSLQIQIENLQQENPAIAVEALEAEFEEVRVLREQLEQLLTGAEQQIEKLADRSWQTLDDKLNEAVDNFIDDQRDVIRNLAIRNKITSKPKEHFNVDLLSLQIALEIIMRKAFDKSRRTIDVALNNLQESVRSAIQGKFADSEIDISLQGLPHDTFTSTLALSKKSFNTPLIFDRGWSFWKKKEVDISKTFETMRVLAIAEFNAPIQKMLRAQNEALVERATVGADRIRVMLRMVDNSMSEKLLGLKRSQMQMADPASNPDGYTQLSERLQAQIETLERRIRHLSVSDSAISGVVLSKAA